MCRSTNTFFNFVSLFYHHNDNNIEMHRARIVECIKEHKNNVANDKVNIKFRCSVNNDEYEEIIAYNDLLDHINKAGSDVRMGSDVVVEARFANFRCTKIAKYLEPCC